MAGKSDNSYPSDEIESAFHRQLLAVLHRSTSAIFWGDGKTVTANGSMFFLDTGVALLAVTAAHVYRGYIDCVPSQRIKCQIDSLDFSPEERLVAVGDQSSVDIATFRVTKQDLAFLRKEALGWPPVIPQTGDWILLCGCPGVGRSAVAAERVEFTYYTAMYRVQSLTDRTISTVKPPNDQLTSLLGGDFPPPQMDMGGMSGGPMVALRKTENGIIVWRSAGVIFEGHSSFEITSGIRADFINQDGTLKGIY